MRNKGVYVSKSLGAWGPRHSKQAPRQSRVCATKQPEWQELFLEKDRALTKATEETMKAKDETVRITLQLSASKDELSASKDELVQQLSARVQQLSASKDELMQQLSASKDQAAEAKEEALRLGQRLQAANDQVLHLEGRRNLRGAIEYLAENIKIKGGTQEQLSSLKEDKGFAALLVSVAKRNNLVYKDLTRCLDGLYHSLSKYMHGTGNVVVIDQVKIAITECAVFGALFEWGRVSYEVYDAKGTLLIPSPYQLPLPKHTP